MVLKYQIKFLLHITLHNFFFFYNCFEIYEHIEFLKHSAKKFLKTLNCVKY